MYKFLISIILLSPVFVFSQHESSERHRNNKISVDIIKPFYGHFIITYERLLTSKYSVGVKLGNLNTERTVFNSFYWNKKIQGVSSEFFFNFNYFQKVKSKTINTHFMGFFINFKDLDYYGRDINYPDKGVYDYFDMKTISGGFTLGRRYLYPSGFSFEFFAGGGVSKCLNDFFYDDVNWLYYPNGFILKAGIEIGYNF